MGYPHIIVALHLITIKPGFHARSLKTLVQAFRPLVIVPALIILVPRVRDEDIERECLLRGIRGTRTASAAALALALAASFSSPSSSMGLLEPWFLRVNIISCL